MPTWVKQLKVLAWDLDGTLYPSVSALDEAIMDQIISALAMALSCSVDAAKIYYSRKKQELKSSTKVLDSAGINGNAFFLNIWLKLPLEQYIQPNPDLQQLFIQNQQVAHVLHTNSNTLETITRKLNCLSISINNFSTIFTSAQMKCQKPDTQAFEVLVDAMKVAPAEILYIGDRVEIDLLPAKNSGLHTCLITYRHKNTTVFQPDLTFATPNKILKYIDSLNTLLYCGKSC